MKRMALFVVLLWAVRLLGSETISDKIERTFMSPTGSITAAVAAEIPARSQVYPPIYSLGVLDNGSFVPFERLPPSLYFAEYHGTAWFYDVEPQWIEDRFLIFEDRYGIAIADVKSRRILLDHVFEAYQKSPLADKWVAIRFRATDRRQESLDANFQDTILVIDPYDAANRIANATEENFVGQMKAVNPGGVVLAKPEWSPDGSTFAVLTWNGGAVKAVRYDANLNETGRTAVNLQVDRESALSLGLNLKIADEAKSILSDPTIFH